MSQSSHFSAGYSNNWGNWYQLSDSIKQTQRSAFVQLFHSVNSICCLPLPRPSVPIILLDVTTRFSNSQRSTVGIPRLKSFTPIQWCAIYGLATLLMWWFRVGLLTINAVDFSDIHYCCSLLSHMYDIGLETWTSHMRHMLRSLYNHVL